MMNCPIQQPATEQTEDTEIGRSKSLSSLCPLWHAVILLLLDEWIPGYVCPDPANRLVIATAKQTVRLGDRI